MTYRTPGGCLVPILLAAAASLLIKPLIAPVHAQQRGGQAAPPATARSSAPVDVTGYWVSIVSEDWRIRMITPQKGDYPGIPINAAARRIADSWDPAKDEAGGTQCKGYAAPHIMREPGRFHITWENDSTLRNGHRLRDTNAIISLRQAAIARRRTHLARLFGRRLGTGRAGAPGREGRPWKSEGSHDSHASRVCAEEWRPFQRGRPARRVL